MHKALTGSVALEPHKKSTLYISKSIKFRLKIQEANITRVCSIFIPGAIEELDLFHSKKRNPKFCQLLLSFVTFV